MEYSRNDYRIAKLRCKLCRVKYEVSDQHNDLDYCEQCKARLTEYTKKVITK